MAKIQHLISAAGEFEKQIEGIHENLLLLKLREIKFPALVESLDWFLFSDIIGNIIKKHRKKMILSFGRNS